VLWTSREYREHVDAVVWQAEIQDRDVEAFWRHRRQLGCAVGRGACGGIRVASI